MVISWYNNSVKKRGDIQKQDIKKMIMFQVWLLNMTIQKSVYINIVYGGKAPKIYIRPYYNLIGAKKKMKKFNDILKDVNKTYKKIKELDEKTEELQNTYLNIMDIKERREKRKTVENEMIRLEEKKKDLQITIKILNSNAKIALYNEALPVVLEVLAKYKNKPYGPKTEKKIRDETKEKINCSFYISDRYNSQEYHIIPLEYSCNTYNIECGPQYIDGKQKKLLDDNKIQALELNDLTLYYSSKEYIDNIPKRIKELKRLYKKAYEKQQELDTLCSKYNSLAVGNIKNIYKDKNIYPTTEI